MKVCSEIDRRRLVSPGGHLTVLYAGGSIPVVGGLIRDCRLRVRDPRCGGLESDAELIMEGLDRDLDVLQSFQILMEAVIPVGMATELSSLGRHWSLSPSGDKEALGRMNAEPIAEVNLRSKVIAEQVIERAYEAGLAARDELQFGHGWEGSKSRYALSGATLDRFSICANLKGIVGLLSNHRLAKSDNRTSIHIIQLFSAVLKDWLPEVHAELPPAGQNVFRLRH